MKYQNPYGVSVPGPEAVPGADKYEYGAPYINGDPTIGQQGSIPPAASIEYDMRELVNFITASDQVPTDANLFQLTHGIRNQFVNFCVDTGAVNALSVALDPPVAQYKAGMPLRVLVANTNSGPSSISVNGLPVRQIKRSNAADLAAGDMPAGGIANLVDDGTNFQLTNFLGAPASTVTTVNIKIPYAEDSSLVANAVVANFSPAITAPAVGDLVEVKIARTNDLAGPTTIKVNALTAIPICRTDGQPLQTRDLDGLEVILLEYHGAYWQMMRLVRSQVYFKLTADLTLYVRTDGNDANDGSVNDAAHAFRTIQGCIDFVSASFLIGARTVVIKLGIPGTYSGYVGFNRMGGNCRLEGDAANRTAYIVSSLIGTGFPAVVGITGMNVDFVGLTLHHGGYQPGYNPAGAGGTTIYAGLNSLCTFRECRFSAAGTLHDYIWVYGAVFMSGNIDFMNSSQNCIQVLGGYFNTGPTPCTMFFNSTTWGLQFQHVHTGGIASWAGSWTVFTGAAFGRKYAVVLNSVINSGGGGPGYLPGSVAGIVDGTSAYS